MKLSFYGADRCVTGSCHCLEVNGRRILVDCGLQQGRDEVSNDAFPFAANDIDFVLVTHAHIDHTGRIPMLVKQGFQGRIVATRLTADLMGRSSPPGSPPTCWISCYRTPPTFRSRTRSIRTARTSAPDGLR